MAAMSFRISSQSTILSKALFTWRDGFRRKCEDEFV